MTVKEMREARAKAVADARKIQDRADSEKRGLSAEEQGQVRQFLDEADKHKRAADEAAARDRLTEHERELTESAGRRTDEGVERKDGDRGGSERGDRGRDGESRGGGDRGREEREITWRLRSGRTRRLALAGRAASADYRDHYARYLATGERRGLIVATDGESRDLQADADVSGGYLVAPLQMTARLIQAVDDQVFVRQYATIVPVTKAQSLGAASLDADPDDGEWTSEIQAGGNDTAMAFGGRELHPTLLSKEVRLSRKLLRLAPDVEGLVMERLGYKFSVTEEKQYLLGNGANKPLGVFVAHPAGIPTSRDMSTGNGATEIKGDGLIRAKFHLKGQYRGRARWLFHRDAVAQICLLKDGNGQYLWRQGLTTGEPDTILGIPLDESEFAPNTFTTGKYVGILADWHYYWIAEATQFSIQRLDELYAKQNKVGFIGRRELDAMPVLAEAFVRVKLA